MSLTRQIIALAGSRGSGKSTIAQHLANKHGFERLAFSDVLREIALLAGPEHINDRKYLSELGLLLRTYQPDFLLTVIQHKISSSSQKIVIEDIRFPEELIFCQINNISTVYLDVNRTEQLRRLKKREQCSTRFAEELVDMADEHRLSIKAGWDKILISEGDFRVLATTIASMNMHQSKESKRSNHTKLE
ncbi:MAG: hypothetical protein CMA63_07360 [Euryarchaeota archaeon]|nr:hypothetical protein [Euryarchaeota archaeon]